MILRPANWVLRFFRSFHPRHTPMPDQIKYAHHELDPVLMQGHEALIFINGHWQGMCHVLALNEAKLMSKDDFYRVFGMVADHVPATAWQTT